ncbi:MAG: zincin-like metallopeptidase domain-containing protein [Thermodesulfobacteriota bacterium]|nr:zincin-like metallopeptidase domain-containing protein [Thermodesulfobacteriota bacterium]
MPNLKHGGSEAYYSKSRDYIAMPVRESFENIDFYYSTVYHEIVHWTGHPSRLQRKFGKRFGDQDYAFEQMRHPGYINSWLRILKQDKRAIFTAAAKAQTSVDFVLDKSGLASDEEECFSKAA